MGSLGGVCHGNEKPAAGLDLRASKTDLLPVLEDGEKAAAVDLSLGLTNRHVIKRTNRGQRDG